MNRRDFIKTGSLAAAGAGMAAGVNAQTEKEKTMQTPSAEWARIIETSEPDEHGAIRKKTVGPRSKDPRPNILLLYTDQQTHTAMSCAGNPWVRTPRMDYLARRGVRFARTYCPAPVCGPSRSSLLYGLMPHETGVKINGMAPHDHLQNLGHHLRDAGYDTTWMGKWHLPDSYADGTEVQGFHYHRHPKDLLGGWLGDATDMHTAQRASHYLRWHAGLSDKPWFLGVSLHNPHDICLHFPPKSLHLSVRDPEPEAADLDRLPPLPPNHAVDPNEPEMVQRRRSDKGQGEMSHVGHYDEKQWRTYLNAYYHLAQSVDRCLAPILDSLEEGGWMDHTLVIFTSDHGEGVAAHKWVTKLCLYEEPMRVPFIAVPPGGFSNPRGRVDNEHVVTGLDFMPTVLDYADVKIPENMRGRSIRGWIEGGRGPDDREYIVSELHPDAKNLDETGRMVVTPDGWKYCRYSSGARPEQLFDLNTDPGETVNLTVAVTAAGQLKRLRGYLAAWCKNINDPFTNSI